MKPKVSPPRAQTPQSTGPCSKPVFHSQSCVVLNPTHTTSVLPPVPSWKGPHQNPLSIAKKKPASRLSFKGQQGIG